MRSNRWLTGLFLFGVAGIGIAACGEATDGEETDMEAAAPASATETAAEAAVRISLGSGLLDTSRPLPEPPAALRARPAATNEHDVVLVKFPGPATAEQLEALHAASERVYTYLPHYTYLVKMSGGTTTRAALSSMGASWSGLYHPAYKISKEIASVAADPQHTAGGAAQARQSVMVHVYPDADLQAVERAMVSLGAPRVVGSGHDAKFSRLRLLLTPSQIAALREPLARLRDVFWIELEGRRVLLNDTTVWVGQSGLSGGQTTSVFQKGIYGQGQVVGILDTGIDPDSCFFRDTSLGLPPTNACDSGIVVNSAQRKVLAVDFLWSTDCAGGIASNEWDNHGHGTHVAGTVAGDNFANLLTPRDTSDGMAPGAKLVIQDGGLTTDNCADLPGIGCPVVDLKPLFQQAYDQGARIHTNSWGDNENSAVQNNYSVGSQDADQFMWDHKDTLIFFAAGNSGPGTGTVGSPSTNKNGVSVGATLRGTSADSMASFSSCGPTTDGRIKPDITVPGSSIVSAGNDTNTGSNNCGSATMSGTSMATPGAAGLTALIRQYYTDGFYPSGSQIPADGFTPTAALLKATLIGSAINMGGATAMPSNCQGWGRVTLDNALFFTDQGRKLWVKDDDTSFASGSTNEDRTYTFSVTNSAEPLKVTLAWTDYPSTPAAAINLVNDIDLIVTGPSGTYLGNVFASGVSATGGTADRRNTVEQVLLTNPPTGVYTVTVRSFNVPSGPQPFAVVVSGAFGASCTGNADCDDGLVCSGTETCVSGYCQAGGGTCGTTDVTFTSAAAQDGYVLESTETSNVGGTINSTASTTSALRVGDDNTDKQYKSVVSFDTSSIPDGATIVSAKLRLLRGTLSGTNPFTTHGTCWVDVQAGSGFSGSTTLQAGDFQATATAVQSTNLSNAAANGSWSEGNLDAAGLAAINKTGTTQLRIYFSLDDNDDTGNDYLGYYSGNHATAANRPQLLVTYQ